jgi:glycerol-3-phosphate dehydrogenase (NAD(P)+)
VKILCEQPSIQISWWLRDQKDIDHIRAYHHNPSYLSDILIPASKVKPFEKIKDAVKRSDYIILVIPAAFIQQPLQSLTSKDLAGKTIISAIKGMVPDENILVTDWVHRVFHIPHNNLSVIAGPCHAEEVALEKQSYLSIASESPETAQQVAALLRCRFVQANPIQDLYGVEYAAVMKNIIALAAGIGHGLGYGDNLQAVLVSNAMQEMNRFVTAVDSRERDMNASAYLGDLLVTAYSQFSRNRLFGNMIGRGYSVQAAQLEMNMIAEGYYAAKSIYTKNQEYGVVMPIVNTVYSILYEKEKVEIAFKKLLDDLK